MFRTTYPVFLMASLTQTAEARSLKATADRLGQEVTKIGFALALFGLAVGAIFLLMGKHDASNRIAMVLLGALLLGIGPALIEFIKSIT